MSQRTTLQDLPQLTVTEVGLRADSSPFVKGYFTNATQVHVTPPDNEIGYDSWLRMSDGYPLWGNVTQLEPTTGFATFDSQVDLPSALIVGQTLTWFDAYWGSHQVNAILDDEHEWTEVVFEASDSLQAEGLDGALPIPAGHARLSPDGLMWRRADTPPLPNERLVKGGWNHEHCLICSAHISPGQIAFVDPGNYWLCKTCHADFAKPRNLSFVR